MAATRIPHPFTLAYNYYMECYACKAEFGSDDLERTKDRVWIMKCPECGSEDIEFLINKKEGGVWDKT